MGGYHPEAPPPAHALEQRIAALLTRIKNVESRLTALPLVAVQAAPVTTSSATSELLWRLLGIIPSGWTVSVTAYVELSDPTANASLELHDSAGNIVSVAACHDTGNVTVTVDHTPDGEFYSLWASTDSGTLGLIIVSCYTGPWSVLTD